MRFRVAAASALRPYEPLAMDALGLPARGPSSAPIWRVNMRKAILLAALTGGALTCGARAESGSFTIHMILHAIGEERYEIARDDSGLALKTSSEYSDRGMKRTA